MTEVQASAVGLRRVPQQARSRARVDAVIGALFQLVSEVEAPSTLTTAEVAERAGVPLGSLYEYFEDLPAIVDAAVARVLDRHDELLHEVITRPPRSIAQLVDGLFEGYRRLYVEEYGFLALRNSTLFERRHRQWLTDRVAAFVRQLGERGVAWGTLSGRADLVERLDFLFALGDAVLQAGLHNGPPGDPEVFDEGRALLRYAARRLARSGD